MQLRKRFVRVKPFRPKIDWFCLALSKTAERVKKSKISKSDFKKAKLATHELNAEAGCETCKRTVLLLVFIA